MSEEFGKPLIAATDTHSLNQYKAECRMVLKYGKTDGEWGDNENEYDLTYKTFDELKEAFATQNSLPEEVYHSLRACRGDSRLQSGNGYQLCACLHCGRASSGRS